MEPAALQLRVHPSTFCTNLVAVETVFRALARSLEPPVIVLDMSDIGQLDSRALNLLLDLKQGLEGRGGYLWLSHVSPSLRCILEYVRLDRLYLLEPQPRASGRGAWATPS